MAKQFEVREQVELVNQGEKIFGILHRPLTEETFPAVLFCHGLAGHHIGHHRVYVLLAEELAKVGIGSFRMDFRGSGDSEGNFSEMSLEGEVSDGMVALRHLTKREGVDPERIGIFGRSFGGALAILIAARLGGVRSLALWAPVFSSKQWEEEWEKHQTGELSEEERHALMLVNGQLPSLSFYAELFALDVASRLERLKEIPLLHIHGEKDPVISIEHAELYERCRQSATAESRFIRLPHSDHDFTHPEEKHLAIRETVLWFARTLLGAK